MAKKQGQQQEQQKKHKVFLGTPVGGDGSVAFATHEAICQLHHSIHDVEARFGGSSALTFNFNNLWAEAINRRLDGEPFDVFAMIHTDIAPQAADWLDKLLEIFDRTNADVLSVIVPIKDSKGLTSTALDTSRWTPRRLTMTEVYELPKTFDGQYVQERFGAQLLLNTGLMVVRLTESWALEVCFHIDNCITRGRDGRFAAFFEPEDWKFSRWCNARGLKLVATREVIVGHLGGVAYTNDGPWGSMAVDSINLTNSALGQLGAIPQK